MNTLKINHHELKLIRDNLINFTGIIEWYDAGGVYCTEYRKNGKLHREDGPAVTYVNGKCPLELWWINGSSINKVLFLNVLFPEQKIGDTLKTICSVDLEFSEIRAKSELRAGILIASRYVSNNGLALFLELEDGRAHCKVSINVDADLEDNEFVLNHDIELNARFILELLERNLIENTGKTVSYGYVKDRPVFRVTVPLY